MISSVLLRSFFVYQMVKLVILKKNRNNKVSEDESTRNSDWRMNILMMKICLVKKGGLVVVVNN